MSVVAFDTHAAVTALREAGFDERQAEGVVATVRDAVAEGVATRADVDRLEDRMATRFAFAEVKAALAEVKAALARLEGRIKRVEDKMVTKADLAEVRADIARLETRMFIGMLTAVGAIVALVKLLP